MSCSYNIHDIAIVGFLLIVMSLILAGLRINIVRAMENEKTFALNFLEQVADVKLDAYDISFISYPGGFDEEWRRSVSSLWVTLIAESEVKAEFYFVNGSFEYFRIEKGRPLLRDSTPRDALYRANRTIRQYMSVFNKTYCAAFVEMLRNVGMPLCNQTIEGQEASLIIDAHPNYASFSWVYVYNGIKASWKRVNVHFNDGYLTFFSVGWERCQIATTDINVTEEEALKIAYDMAKKYADETNVNIIENKTTIALSFSNDLGESARGGDPFMLYPRWCIEFSYDKVRMGVVGYTVLIWADNGEASGCPKGFFIPPSEPNDNPQITYDGLTSILLATGTFAVICILVAYKRDKLSKHSK